MSDEEMIERFASDWIEHGGDSDGFAWVQSKILERLRQKEGGRP